MIVHLVAGGPKELTPNLNEYNTDPNIFWIGVDKGTQYLLKSQIIPNMAIGDFDSITEEELENYKFNLPNIQIFKPEKDETDMELAIHYALKKNPSKIRIFAATGGRLDHLFANVFILLHQFSAKNTTIEIIDRQNSIEVKQPGEYMIENDPLYKYISFIPLTVVEGLSLRGFKYELTNHTVPFGSTLCISNELIQDNGNFSFTNGILLVIRANDAIG